MFVSELVREQMLKVKPQHGKQGYREHVLCTVYSMNSAVRVTETVYSTVCAMTLGN